MKKNLSLILLILAFGSALDSAQGDELREVTQTVYYSDHTRPLKDHCIDGLHLRPKENFIKRTCLERRYSGTQVIQVNVDECRAEFIREEIYKKKIFQVNEYDLGEVGSFFVVEKMKLNNLPMETQKRDDSKWKTIWESTFDIPFCADTVVEEPINLYQKKSASLKEYLAFRMLVEKGIHFAFDNPIDNLGISNGGLTSPQCQGGEIQVNQEDRVETDLRNFNYSDGDENGPLPGLGGEGSGSGRVLRDWLLSGNLNDMLGGEGSGAGRSLNFDRPGQLQMSFDFLNPDQTYIWNGIGLYDSQGNNHLDEIWEQAQEIDINCVKESEGGENDE